MITDQWPNFYWWEHSYTGRCELSCALNDEGLLLKLASAFITSDFDVNVIKLYHDQYFDVQYHDQYFHVQYVIANSILRQR